MASRLRSSGDRAGEARFSASLGSARSTASRPRLAPKRVDAKAQALGETELEADPGFQGALRQASTRFGANLGLDAVDLALPKLAENRASAGRSPVHRDSTGRAKDARGWRKSVSPVLGT